MVRIRGHAEIRAAFEDQVQALMASCASYDQGNMWEAPRLANSVYLMVHDKGSMRSLMGQLGIKDGTKFIATGYKMRKDNLVAQWPLVQLEYANGKASYVPRLGERPPVPEFEPRHVSFKEWWERDTVYASPREKHQVKRKNLVFSLRHKDGGAHYDPELTDPNYIELVHEASPIVFMPAGGSPVPLRQLEKPMMRQIAWELLETLKAAGHIPNE